MRSPYYGGRGDCDGLNGSHNDLKDIDVLAALPTAECDFKLASTRKFFGQLKSLGMPVKILLPGGSAHWGCLSTSLYRWRQLVFCADRRPS